LNKKVIIFTSRHNSIDICGSEVCIIANRADLTSEYDVLFAVPSQLKKHF